ncbi:ATP-dependent DNA ligase [Tepidiforma sp.]|uniref:ATP-dependent DNA ligase n=1 Tax=Tepidiforma sp. TaxID=2682230 RepID=UPI002ADE2AA9|nr:ATP-dependent DNA ligase [Tepidiforma sp.]
MEPELIAPMLAKAADAIPGGEGWLYEPKWDGFRAIVTWASAGEPFLQSRDLKPLGRYFPELVEGLARALPGPAVLDGEIVIMGPRGLDFDALQQRVHPAASRIARLAQETPAAFVAFDLLREGDTPLFDRPLAERRERLERLMAAARPPLYLTPATRDPATAQEWFERFEGAGFDGVIAKRLDGVYQPGRRGWVKVKHLRTADCVVGGFRWNRGEEGRSVGSLLLGLYDDAGVLHFVGHTSSFSAAARRELVERLAPLRTDDEGVGFGQGRTPGAPSRWTGTKDLSWERLRPELVCEVTFDYLQGNRFRHAATFQRWRPDRDPRSCTFDQLEAPVPAELRAVFER